MNIFGITLSKQALDALFVGIILVGFSFFLVYGTKSAKPSKKE